MRDFPRMNKYSLGWKPTLKPSIRGRLVAPGSCRSAHLATFSSPFQSLKSIELVKLPKIGY